MVFRTIIELLAAIPSVVFGLWGIYVLIPLCARWRTGCTKNSAGSLFSTSLSGPGLAPAALVWPSRSTHGRVHFRGRAAPIPYKVKGGRLRHGHHPLEAILKVMLPTASSGILAALVLGFGRALGETMALAMLIGNSNQISLSLFAPAKHPGRAAGVQLPEGRPFVEIRALMYAALALLAITLIVNAVGLAVMKFATRKFEVER